MNDFRLDLGCRYDSFNRALAGLASVVCNVCMPTTNSPYMGITVTLLKGPDGTLLHGTDGEPLAQVTIAGTTADQEILVDDSGLELAFSHSAGQFHVADARTVS